MESLQSRELGFAQTDYADRLLKADGLLGSLNVECGGRIGATLAIPELLDIVVKAREYTSVCRANLRRSTRTSE